MSDWEFVCDGCNRTSPEKPACTVCGATFVFHGTPDGDAAMDGATRRLREYLDAHEKSGAGHTTDS